MDETRPETGNPTPPLKIKFSAEDVDILARTIYGEARGEGLEGRIAVAWTVINRVRRAERRGGYWWGETVAQVCLKPWQYSCWNENNPNREKLMLVTLDNPVFAECRDIAGFVLDGDFADPTNGALHYMTKARREKSWPGDWGEPKEPSAEIGEHLFYNDVE